MMPFQNYNYTSVENNPYVPIAGYVAISVNSLEQLNASITLMTNREGRLIGEMESLQTQL